jgi:hypothetical protein
MCQKQNKLTTDHQIYCVFRDTQLPLCVGLCAPDGQIGIIARPSQRSSGGKQPGEGDVEHTWTCSCCGRSFNTLPMDYAFSAPHNWFALPEAERASRAKLSADLCMIDGVQYYVRGCVEIPVSDSLETFVWGVWVSVSEQSFRYILDRWTSPISPDEPPRFGWLNNWITGYPEPREIKCQVFLRSNNQRPRIVLEPTDYPLAVEQQQGITLERVKQIVAAAGHS